MDHLGLELHDLKNIPWEGSEYDTEVDFRDFPQKAGWKLNGKYGLLTDSKQHLDFVAFLQAWLFFGLLHTVLKASDNNINVNQEFKTFKATSHYITTETLGERLNKWQQYEQEQWEKAEDDPDVKKRYSIRMIRIQMALDCAREVVRRYCSIDGPKPADNAFQLPQDRQDERFGLISLSLIVLGETLSNAKAKIVERIGSKIRGWHGDATQGWGTSGLIKKMMKKEWCHRTLHVLEGQFCGNTTGLIAAYSLQPFRNNKHEGCTKESCKKSHVEDKKKYKMQHYEPCSGAQDEADCGWHGPEPADLQRIIKRGAIPLLVMKNGDSPAKVAIGLTSTLETKDYITISHVWSDGYGNPDRNKLCQCQLKSLKAALDSIENTRNTSIEHVFWMDTLAIPVGDDYLEERKIAIGRIHETFVRSRYTIVIDQSLRGLRRTEYHEIAMGILASGWMRRLWTLQEAYLSERIFFQLADQTLELEHLERMYHSANHTLNSCIPAIARSYFHSLLGTARKARIHDMTPKEGLSLIGSVWKATQWRTTTHKEHEVLALATLFDLNADRSKDARSINEAFVAKKTDPDLLEKNMCTLLKLLEQVYPGSIPAGIIFLPGDKLSMKGFRWAPRTWMEGYGVDYPDPLALDTSPARLVPDEGLYVQFPGILLHSMPKTSPITKMEKNTHLRFPVDSSLTEWYEVKYADEPAQESNHSDWNSHSKRYAIILPRQRPRDLEEIALMAEIWQSNIQRSFENNKETCIFHISVEFRVKVRRVSVTGDENGSDDDLSLGKENTSDDEDDDASGAIDERVAGGQVFGEVLDHDQRWCVDQEDRSDALSEVSSQKDHSDALSEVPSPASPDVGSIVVDPHANDEPFTSDAIKAISNGTGGERRFGGLLKRFTFRSQQENLSPTK